ncbi:hypothetical protein ACH42_10140 [Endozoicomonas sp. (ex Bugula neritina AB1)]|nr:hypothetical protein ACH42_10140 [Endozoicomonas sp. (ex Bugula neritina AB1)]
MVEYLSGEADLIITGSTPPGFLGEPLTTVDFIPVASPEYPLHQINHSLTNDDLKKHRPVVIRDSGFKRTIDVRWLGSEERWTVSHISTSIRLLKRNMGFAWLPTQQIRKDLNAGDLVPLNVGVNQKNSVEIFLVFPDPDSAGPAMLKLAQIFRDQCNAVQNS